MSPNPSDLYILVTGANSGLGLSICLRLLDEHLSRVDDPPKSPLSSLDDDTASATTGTRPKLTIILTTRSLAKSNATLTTLARHLSRYPSDQQDLITFQPESVDLTSLLSVRRLAGKLLTDGSVPWLNAIICNAGIGGWTGIDWPACIWAVLTDLVQAITFPPFKKSSVGNITAKQLPVGIRHAHYPGENKTAEAPAPPGANGDTVSSSTTSTKKGLSEPQNRSEPEPEPETEPPLGEVFTANVFGHYMLAHYLMPLLSSPSPRNGRIIFVSTVEDGWEHFSLEDPQGIWSLSAYDSSKRLVDLLALTSRSPSTKHWVNPFLDPTPTPSLLRTSQSSKTKNKNKWQNHNDGQQQQQQLSPPLTRPKIYLSHPGVCGTSIVPLPWILQLLMFAAFYLARLLGSPWHTTVSYLGATSSVWLALSPQHVLDGLEEETPPDAGSGRSRPMKWGSSVSRLGQERVRSTEVHGWGLRGLQEADAPLIVRRGASGRKRGSRVANAEDIQAFEDEGRKAWMYMERLRGEWEERLDRFEREQRWQDDDDQSD